MQKPKCLIISNRGNRIFPSIYKMAGCKLKAYFFYYLQNGSMQTQSIIDLLVYRNQVQVKQAGDRSSTPLSSVTILLLTKLTWFRVNNTGNSTKSLPWILCSSLCTRSSQKSEYLRTILISNFVHLSEHFGKSSSETCFPTWIFYLRKVEILIWVYLIFHVDAYHVHDQFPPCLRAHQQPHVTPLLNTRGAVPVELGTKCFEFTRVVQSSDSSRSHAVSRAA